MITEVYDQDDLISALKERSEMAVRDGSGASITQLLVRDVGFAHITFTGLHIANVIFRGCKFSRVRFHRCTLDRLGFEQGESHPYDTSDLVECTFTNCTIYALRMTSCRSENTQVRNSIVVSCSLQVPYQKPKFTDCMLLSSEIYSDSENQYPTLDQCILADCTRVNYRTQENPPTGFLPSPFIGSALMVAAGHDHHLNSPFVLSQYQDEALKKIYAIAYNGLFLAGKALIPASDPSKVDLGKWTSHIRKNLTRIIEKSDPESFDHEYEKTFSLIPEHLRAAFVETVISVLVQQLTMFEALQKS